MNIQQFTKSGRTIVPVEQKNQFAADQLSAMAQAAEIRRQRIIALNQIPNKTPTQIDELSMLMSGMNMGGRSRTTKRRRTNKRRKTNKRRTNRKRTLRRRR
jgi:hypothetical protein